MKITTVFILFAFGISYSLVYGQNTSSLRTDGTILVNDQPFFANWILW